MFPVAKRYERAYLERRSLCFLAGVLLLTTALRTKKKILKFRSKYDSDCFWTLFLFRLVSSYLGSKFARPRGMTFAVIVRAAKIKKRRHGTATPANWRRINEHAGICIANSLYYPPVHNTFATVVICFVNNPS